MKVTKAAGVELSGAPSEEQLEKINRLTKAKVLRLVLMTRMNCRKRRSCGKSAVKKRPSSASAPLGTKPMLRIRISSMFR